ncbi:N-6 DNA methylase [Lachnospiraceae bacterium 29-84]
MKTFINKMQKKFSKIDVQDIEITLIRYYINTKRLNTKQSSIVNQFMQKHKSRNAQLEEYISMNASISGIDELITAFELLINSKDKKNNGMIYTPVKIKDYIVKNVIISKEIPSVVDPACGCGSFLITAARWMHKKYNISYSEIFKKNIIGFDVDEHSIEKAKLLFELLTIEEEGTALNCKLNLNVANSVEELSKKKYTGKYDVVIGNPPYVRAKNIADNVKPYLKEWSVVAGNIDLYILFYEIAIRLLKKQGIMGYISPNTFLQSVNGRGLRNYLVKCGYEITLLDFRETQAFKEVTHYTCICIIDKAKIQYKVKYALLNGKSSLNDYSFTEYNIKEYQHNKEWRFANPQIDRIVKQIEAQPHKLDDFKIRNGLATLNNEIYFFNAIKEDDNFYYREYKEKTYPIEKGICIDVIKPNVIRTEADLENYKEKAIFPYMEDKKIMPEEYVSEYFPMTYKFLLSNKELLLKRDKGKTKKYATWYAYGRTQGMTNQGKKLLIPYMAEKGIAVKSLDEKLLFYCGYAVFCDDDEQMELLKAFIESDVFLFYITNTSKPYSKGYMALAKNYIKNFGIPKLNKEQIRELFLIQDNNKRQEFIKKIYGVSI